MKYDKETIEAVLCDYDQIDLKTRAEIIKKIEDEEKANKPEPEPKEKKDFVIIALTDNEDISEVPMYIVQKPESSVAHTDVVNLIKQATAEHNTTPKGRKSPVTKLADAMGDVKRKCLTSRDISVKTKEPTIIVTSENEFDFGDMETDDG